MGFFNSSWLQTSWTRPIKPSLNFFARALVTGPTGTCTGSCTKLEPWAASLRDAITRNNGLRVPIGNYYLCDNGYVNGEGFLTPFRGLRYHLDDWGQGRYAPQYKEELFNMKHSKAWGQGRYAPRYKE